MADQKRIVDFAVVTYAHSDGSHRFALAGDEIELNEAEAGRLDRLGALQEQPKAQSSRK